MAQKLIIFSGLPGTGKTTLSKHVARQMRLPLLRIDDVVDAIPPHMRTHADPFWEEMIGILLKFVEAQLQIGLSVVVDSVFMDVDRVQAQTLAQAYGAQLRPIHTFVSDETVWRARLAERAAAFPHDEPATWSQIRTQRLDFWPWRPGSALFVDGMAPLDENMARVMEFVTADTVDLLPIEPPA